MEATRTDEALDLLVFELAGARYALELSCVREVVRAVFITPLPGAPAVVEGIVDVRGEVVPVYDLRLRFGLPPRPLHPDEELVTAWTGDRRVGIRCERADWLGRVEASRVRDPAGFRVRNSRVSGVVQLEDGLVLIHDLSAFLEQGESEALDRALAEVPAVPDAGSSPARDKG
jgi:purine-binding chemotaxis protein CheW